MTASKRRDVFVWAVCNWLLNHVATKEYCAFISVLISMGLKQFEKELGVGNNP